MDIIDGIKSRLVSELKVFREALNIQNEGIFEKKILDDIVKILATKPIQALEHRLQLGLVYNVLGEEKGKHTRFAHTVGVVAKCIVTADLINKNTHNKQLRFTEVDVRELAVAACLHDCGHFPISHATERAFLTAKNLTKGTSHEERILPLIVNRNSYFEELRNIVLSWGKEYDENTFFRIACIISPNQGEEYVKSNDTFKRPKKAIQQLLVSDIDMDRLDYIIRDANELNYLPVKLIADKLVAYVKGLTLEIYKSLNQPKNSDNVELCLASDVKENVFYLLVSRVLLYKYIYFSDKVRRFEAILTYLVGTLIEEGVAFEPLKLIAMSDNEFLNSYLLELVKYIEDKEDLQRHLREKYINVLKHDKVVRFNKLESIYDFNIVNPRLKEEFQKNINKRSYIDNLRKYIYSKAGDIDLEQGDILLDIFYLKTGGGELLVKEEDGELKTLNFFMNGSNMHRLCSENRLDIYMKSDLSDRKKKFVSDELNKFFKEI